MKDYYARRDVRQEIIDFCRGRWAALEGEEAEKRTFIRYWHRGRSKPLTINTEHDIDEIFKRFFWLKPRTFYASAGIYKSLANPQALEAPDNIAASTPTFDVDCERGGFKDVMSVVGLVVDELAKLGISRSVYILWSGNGAHVRIHEGAFSRGLLQRHNPLDAAYAIVAYVLKRIAKNVEQLSKERGVSLKVENLMDIKRVFTAPLSLHRRLDLAAVCLKPNEINDFDISWASLESPRHNPAWRDFSEGEADNAAQIALTEIPGYFAAASEVRLVVGEEKTGAARESPRVAAIGRFQIMALLQAARYYILFGDLDKAKSFGLNRAIFYAWAKKRGTATTRRREATRPAYETREKLVASVGDEQAYLSSEGWFTIGGDVQTPRDYDREIVSRIERFIPYEEAWAKAVEYVRSFDRKVLESQRDFYEKVYQPVRDKFLREA
ncbi:MAG: hypothetical protein NXY59_00095 [Aigarchaeota archaeon]|nr:hypothetical protein [Candidatus Pelearchaeum maunauluense]